MVYIGRLFLPYISDANNAGGCVVPFATIKTIYPPGCKQLTCRKIGATNRTERDRYGNIEAWRQLTKYVADFPLYVQRPGNIRRIPGLWDIAYTMYTNTLNYGLGL